MLVTLSPLGVSTQIPVSDALGEDLPDVPRFPGMVRTPSRIVRFSDECLYVNMGYLADSSTISGSTLKNFYVAEMPGYEWTLVSENLFPPVENFSFLWEATFQKTGARVELRVDEVPLFGETGVEIIYRIAEAVEIENIPVGGSRTLEFRGNKIVSDVEITAKAAISGGTVRMEVVAQQEVPAPLENALYYIDLTTDVAENIDKATIRFRIPKKWISENNIDPATMRLWRYTNNQWVELPTQAVGEEENFYIYSAETTGFSIFAVTGSHAVPLQGLPPAWVGVGGALIIVAVVLVLGYWKRSRQR